MFNNQNIIIIAVTFLATVVTLFISEKISDYKLRDIALVVTGFVSISAIILGYVSFYRSERNQKKLNDNIKKLDNLRKSLQNIARHEKLSWLLNEDQLLLIEQSKKNCKEIWIVSPDPSDDTGKSPWVAVIQDNISNGMMYYYIAPNTDFFDGAIKGLKTVFRDNLEKCNVLKLDNKEYHSLPHAHLVVYDPHNHHDESECFAEIDIEEKGWWICLPKNKHNFVVGKLLPLVKESVALRNL